MNDSRSTGGEARPPTWSEREHLEELRKRGVADVYVQPAYAPQKFWEVLLQTTHLALLAPDRASGDWQSWGRKIRWVEGWSEFQYVPHIAYETIVRNGYLELQAAMEPIPVPPKIRFSAVEHLLDVLDPEDDQFETLINDRARWFRVGVQLEGHRFVSVASQHLHKEVVRPALVLLDDPSFKPVDDLYRKAFDRALSNDPAGAVTAATSAVEEMLRLGLGVTGLTLDKLLVRARGEEWITPVVHQLIAKLAALRADSDAHASGTSEFQVAMLALHLTASVLLHLGVTGPFAH